MLKTIILFAASVAVVCAQYGKGPEELKAIVKLVGQNVQGNITFTQLADGKTHVSGLLHGLPAGHYGFHVHEKGDITGGCLSTGGHFNPDHHDHGHPNDVNRHVGDLGNVAFDAEGFSQLDFVDGMISLTGPHNILGRAVVLHEKEDDFGRSDHPDSKKTGNAGGRVACGVIGILDPIYGWTTNAVGSVTFSTSLLMSSFMFILL